MARFYRYSNNSKAPAPQQNAAQEYPDPSEFQEPVYDGQADTETQVSDPEEGENGKFGPTYAKLNSKSAVLSSHPVNFHGKRIHLSGTDFSKGKGDASVKVHYYLSPEAAITLSKHMLSIIRAQLAEDAGKLRNGPGSSKAVAHLQAATNSLRDVWSAHKGEPILNELTPVGKELRASLAALTGQQDQQQQTQQGQELVLYDDQHLNHHSEVRPGWFVARKLRIAYNPNYRSPWSFTIKNGTAQDGGQNGTHVVKNYQEDKSFQIRASNDVLSVQLEGFILRTEQWLKGE